VTCEVPATPSSSAAFFDVDGTLVNSTIVHYYMYFRARRLPPVVRPLWRAAFTVKCLYYLAIDRLNRSRLNVIFYRSYAGLPAAEIKAQVDDCYHEVIAPRRFPQAATCIEAHRAAGRSVVLVTGSIDFIVRPLAERLGAHSVVAPALRECDGRFTGELDGAPVGDEEKARRLREFARRHSIDLAGSYAYGDSIADLPMLECVGHPEVVNPDRALRAIAQARRWPVHCWRLATPEGPDGR